VGRRTRRGHSRGAYPTSRCLALNGVDEYAHAATVGAALTGLTTPSSFVAWVSTSDTDGHIVSAGDDPTNLSDRALAVVGSVAQASWTKDPGTGSPNCTGTTAVDDAGWHHLAQTWDGTTLRVYVDGVEEDNATPTAGDQTLTDLEIGRRVRASSLYLAGSVAEVLVFDRGLTAAEVAALYGGGHWRDPRPLLPRDAFVVAAGDTMIDLGWARAALTLVNAPTVTAGGPNG
jgi:hypothetical protein